MRCITCGNFSFSIVCKECASIYCTPTPKTKILDCGLTVVGFFAYSDIELLIKTKYELVGYFVFNFLAKQTLKQFAQHFSSSTLCNAIAIDDVPNKSGYSHTAILTKALTSDSIRPMYNVLRAKNRIEYAGKSKEFRLNNPRDFIVRKKPNNIILIDDVMTTGSTLTQAYNALDGNVDFAIVLCM